MAFALSCIFDQEDFVQDDPDIEQDDLIFLLHTVYHTIDLKIC